MAGGTPRIVRGYGLYEQLREHKPKKVIASDDEGAQVVINVPDVRQKHARVMAALREISWVRCDLLDAKGGLLYRHNRNADDRETPAGELEDLAPTTARASEVSGLLSVMLKGMEQYGDRIVRAQDAALERYQQGMQNVLDNNQKLLDGAMSRLESSEAQIGRLWTSNQELAAAVVNLQVELARAGASGPANGNNDERPKSDRAVEKLVPHIIRALLAPGDKQAAASVAEAAAAAGVPIGDEKPKAKKATG